MAQNSQEEQNVTYIIEPVSHRRTISIVSQSTLSADVFLTPQSIRHEDFVQKSWIESAHKRSASASSFFSVVSEKDKDKKNGMTNGAVVGFANPGFVNCDEADFSRKRSYGLKESPIREQYWACRTFTAREKIFVFVIILLSLLVLTLTAIILYMHFYHDKDIDRYLPSWIQGRNTNER